MTLVEQYSRCHATKNEQKCLQRSDPGDVGCGLGGKQASLIEGLENTYDLDQLMGLT